MWTKSAGRWNWRREGVPGGPSGCPYQTTRNILYSGRYPVRIGIAYRRKSYVCWMMGSSGLEFFGTHNS